MNESKNIDEHDFDDVDDQDFSEDIPPSEGSMVKFIIKQLHFGMSLTNITLPTFILEPRSTLERFMDWAVHGDLLRGTEKEPDPLIRCLRLCTWIVSGFHMGSLLPKKPYNSVIGEVYRATVVDEKDDIIGCYVAEQVSHHPPITAFHYCDRKGNAIIWGHTEMRSKFYFNSIAALMEHENTQVNYEIPSLGESYTFNFPNMYGKGILVGKMRMEIGGTVKIKCKKTNVKAKIVFLEKPLIGKKYNMFEGYIYQKNKKEPEITFYGRWSAFMKAIDNRNGNVMIPFNVKTVLPLKIVNPPLSEQVDYESKKIWECVTHYLNEKDSFNATKHKHAIEEKQMKEEKYLEENGVPWELQLFHFDKDMNRYVPNDLNLNPYDPNEPKQQMPSGFHIPNPIQQMLDNNLTKTFNEIHHETESNIQTDHHFVFN